VKPPRKRTRARTRRRENLIVMGLPGVRQARVGEKARHEEKQAAQGNVGTTPASATRGDPAVKDQGAAILEPSTLRKERLCKAVDEKGNMQKYEKKL